MAFPCCCQVRTPPPWHGPCWVHYSLAVGLSARLPVLSCGLGASVGSLTGLPRLAKGPVFAWLVPRLNSKPPNGSSAGQSIKPRAGTCLLEHKTAVLQGGGQREACAAWTGPCQEHPCTEPQATALQGQQLPPCSSSASVPPPVLSRENRGRSCGVPGMLARLDCIVLGRLGEAEAGWGPEGLHPAMHTHTRTH